MALLVTCPSCGLASNEVRCPRCNALKVEACDGVCSACANKAGSCRARLSGPQPSSIAEDDPKHPGTPLER